MSFYSNASALNSFVSSHWPGPWVLVSENVPPPTDRTKSWVRYSLRPAVTQAWDIGSTTERATGFMWFQLFLPENTGVNDAYRISDAIRKMCFEKTVIDSLGVLIYLRAASPAYVGVDPSGFNQWRCIVDYQADANPYTQ
jgi:hypothetical protein